MQSAFSLKPNNYAKQIKILWWNVNRRPDTVLKSVSPITTQKPNIIFLSETAMGFDIIPEIANYKKYADQSILKLNHGGIVAYVHKELVSHVFDIKYNTCYVSFRLDFAPDFVFIGIYIQPESSKYFSTDMFSDLSNLLISSNERCLIPVMGGDMNCRFGNLNDTFRNRKLIYEKNTDEINNYHGRTYGADVCNSGNVFPLNHLRYKSKVFDGGYTYYKSDKRSQIDYAFTNDEGMKHIEDFTLIADSWHLSDHLPISVDICLPEAINCSFLLRRAKELNYEYNPQSEKLVRFLSSYDYNIFENVLRKRFSGIDRVCREELGVENIDNALRHIDRNISDIYKLSKVRRKEKSCESDVMNKANENVVRLQKCINGERNENFDDILHQYQESRNAISKQIFSNENQKWFELMNNKNSKELWGKIDWKGDMSAKVYQPPVFEDLAVFFEELYKNDTNDIEKIKELKTDVYDSSLDDPITKKEMDDAMSKMKNGGYDHRIDVFKIMVNVMNPLLLLLLNMLFFVAYPVKLAISFLSALPKKGNLSFVTNYRGIQMLPALAVLYDRVITNRLTSWISVHAIQSAFQKGKSTLHQLFTIRLLIVLAKATNTTLYIGLFDLAKAFDKVSRYQMLKKLIVKGIGNCMLQALKRIYICTYCVLSFGGNVSEKFRTFAGIRQGAASSALLFIGFIDDLVEYLEDRCPAEPLLEILHCLLHADDTLILSTDRGLFINKCNHMLDYFEQNELKLNLSKSEYLIINGKENDKKESLLLSNGYLGYKSIVTYLGIKISDTGNIDTDIDLNISAKKPNVTIKFGNFCRKNFLAPLDIKIRTLSTCVSASLLYGCEVWGKAKISKLESLHRHGLKAALSIRNNINNEIVYVESGEKPLEVRITKLQLRFWMAIKDIVQTDPDHYISKLVIAAADSQYIKYYDQLLLKYPTVEQCEASLTNQYRTTYEEKIRTAAELDSDSRLGTYLSVNPTLTKPLYEHKLEFQRVLISRYRTGSHNLKIETGRVPYTPREERWCRCNTGLQTVRHVLLHCPLLNELRIKHAVVDIENGVMNDNFLIEMEKIIFSD